MSQQAHYTIGKKNDDGTIVVRAALIIPYNNTPPFFSAEQIKNIIEVWTSERLDIFERQDAPEVVDADDVQPEAAVFVAAENLLY